MERSTKPSRALASLLLQALIQKQLVDGMHDDEQRSMGAGDRAKIIRTMETRRQAEVTLRRIRRQIDQLEAAA